MARQRMGRIPVDPAPARSTQLEPPRETRMNMAQPQPCQVAGTRLRLDPEKRNPDLSRFRELMERMVIGQPAASDALADSMSRVLAGVGDPDSPVLSLMLMGPTGVGKTETVRCLAESLFGDRRAFTRVNCQEYSAHYNLTKLLGSPPGYVGGEIKPLLAQENLERHHREAIEEGRGHVQPQPAPACPASTPKRASTSRSSASTRSRRRTRSSGTSCWGSSRTACSCSGTTRKSTSPARSSCSPRTWAAARWGSTSATRASASMAASRTSRSTATSARPRCAKRKKVFPFEFLNRFDVTPDLRHAQAGAPLPDPRQPGQQRAPAEHRLHRALPACASTRRPRTSS